jgi:Chaperone of endosialidase
MSILNAITAGAGGVALSGDTSGNLTIQSAGTNVATVTSTGLGIGTTSPAYALDVISSSAGGTQLRLQNPIANGTAQLFLDSPTGSGNQRIDFQQGGSAKFAFGTNLGAAANSALSIYCYGSATNVMTLDGSGNWMVGTTTQNGANGITISPSTTYGAQMYFNSPYNGTRNAISFAYNSSGVGTIVTGTSSTSYNSGSDYRLKDNPQPLTGSGDFIDALQPKKWTWKVDGKPGVGFIAHEVQAVSPDTVHGEKDAVDAEGKPIIQTMEYGSAEFIANIILELQTLRKRVAALEAKVGA